MLKTLYQLLKLFNETETASQETFNETDAASQDNTNMQPLLLNQDPTNDNSFVPRLRKITELVATIPITNAWWRYCNRIDIGNINPGANKANNTSALFEIIAVGDWKIGAFIMMAVYFDHLIASFIKIASKRQPALPEGFDSLFGPYFKSIIWESFQAFALALKYYFAAVGWTLMAYIASLNIDDSDLKGKTATIFLTGCGSMFGIVFIGYHMRQIETVLFFNSGPQLMVRSINRGNNSQQCFYKKYDKGAPYLMKTAERPLNIFSNFENIIADDGQIRLAAAGLLEGMTWTIMANLLDCAQLPDLLDAILLGVATYLIFCIGYAAKTNPQSIEFYPARLGLFAATGTSGTFDTIEHTKEQLNSN